MSLRTKIHIMAVTEKDWYRKGLQLKKKGHYQKAIQAFNLAIDQKSDEDNQS